MNTVYCPVMEQNIDGTTCLEIVLVADKEASTAILPESLLWDNEKCKKCLACKWHSDIEE